MSKQKQESEKLDKEQIIKDAQLQYKKWEKEYPHMNEKRMLYDLSQAVAFQQDLLTHMFHIIKTLKDGNSI